MRKGEPLTVVCAHIGNKWGSVWVERLHRMVSDHCSVDFQFKVITDHPERFPEWGIPFSREIEWVNKVWVKDSDKLMLDRGKPQGCWGKLDAFLPQFPGPVICLDLDVVILDDIAPLVRENLHMPWQGTKYNGSVYSFTPSAETYRLYPEQIPYSTHPRGEQEFVQETHGAVQPLPGCYSYKIHVAGRGGNPPEDTRIVYFHGFPTPASDSVQNHHWISRTWKGMNRIERI